MKITAIILAIFISYLAVKPGIDMICSVQVEAEVNCCETICPPSSDYDPTNKQEEDSGCNGKTCNPFQVCNSSILLINGMPLIDSFLELKQARFSYQSIFAYQYISDFWHPPEVV